MHATEPVPSPTTGSTREAPPEDAACLETQLGLSHAVILEMQSQLVVARRSATEAKEEAAEWHDKAKQLELELEEARSEKAKLREEYEKNRISFRQNLQRNFLRCSKLESERNQAVEDLQAIQESLIGFSAQVLTSEKVKQGLARQVATLEEEAVQRTELIREWKNKVLAAKSCNNALELEAKTFKKRIEELEAQAGALAKRIQELEEQAKGFLPQVQRLAALGRENIKTLSESVHACKCSVEEAEQQIANLRGVEQAYEVRCPLPPLNRAVSFICCTFRAHTRCSGVIK